MLDEVRLSLKNTDDYVTRKVQSTIIKPNLERIRMREWANMLFGKEVQNSLIVKQFGTDLTSKIETKSPPKNIIMK